VLESFIQSLPQAVIYPVLKEMKKNYAHAGYDRKKIEFLQDQLEIKDPEIILRNLILKLPDPAQIQSNTFELLLNPDEVQDFSQKSYSLDFQSMSLSQSFSSRINRYTITIGNKQQYQENYNKYGIQILTIPPINTTSTTTTADQSNKRALTDKDESENSPSKKQIITETPISSASNTTSTSNNIFDKDFFDFDFINHPTSPATDFMRSSNQSKYIQHSIFSSPAATPPLQAPQQESLLQNDDDEFDLRSNQYSYQ
jgi:hypothetical protein